MVKKLKKATKAVVPAESKKVKLAKTHKEKVKKAKVKKVKSRKRLYFGGKPVKVPADRDSKLTVHLVISPSGVGLEKAQIGFHVHCYTGIYVQKGDLYFAVRDGLLRGEEQLVSDEGVNVFPPVPEEIPQKHMESDKHSIVHLTHLPATTGVQYRLSEHFGKVYEYLKEQLGQEMLRKVARGENADISAKE